MSKISIFIFLTLVSTSLQAQFRSIAQQSGISAVHVTPFLMGGGVAFFDFNNDGLVDLYLTGGQEDDKLYMNLGNDAFLDIAMQSGILEATAAAETFGVTIGDIDNDGFDDIFITVFDHDLPNILLRNNGDSTFTDIAVASGITQNSSSTSATFFDFNNDGFLDIYVANYIEEMRFLFDENGSANGFDHSCYPNFFYLNNGDQTFSEMANFYGLDDAGCGLAVLATDYDNDGDPDLMLANDFGAWISPNVLYQNQNFQHFTDVSAETCFDLGIYGMGFASGDLDHDGSLEYYITNIGENYLLKMNDDGCFENIAPAKGVENILADDVENTTGWGALFFDHNNSGDLDLFVSNGFIPAAPFLNNAIFDPNKFYKNIGEGVFEDVTNEFNLFDDGLNRGAAFADLNNNGKLDFVVSSIARTRVSARSLTSIYQNIMNNSFAWAQVKLEGTVSNRNAFGSKVSVYANGKIYKQEHVSGTSHASQNSAVLHFGLSNAEKIDKILVEWPNGNATEFNDLPVKQRLYIKEGETNYSILGCMDENSISYNPAATIATNCFYREIAGCTDIRATNYVSQAAIDDGSCQYVTSIKESDSQIRFGFVPDTRELSVWSTEVVEGLLWQEVNVHDLNGRRISAPASWENDRLTIDFSRIEAGVYVLSCIPSDVKKEAFIKKILIR